MVESENILEDLRMVKAMVKVFLNIKNMGMFIQAPGNME